MGKKKKEPEPSEGEEAEAIAATEAAEAEARRQELLAEVNAEIDADDAEAEEVPEAAKVEAMDKMFKEELGPGEAESIKEALDTAKVEPSVPYKPSEPAEDKWTSVSGKVLTSEKDAFKAKAKSEDMVPSKLIRAFVQSFINPEPEEAEPAATTDIACEVCGKEITDDYYRFEDTYKCGPCVTDLIKDKQHDAIVDYMRAQALRDATGAKEELPAQPAAEAPAVQPAEPPQPAEELVRVACTKCLAEAFIPKGKPTYACPICNFVNTVSEA